MVDLRAIHKADVNGTTFASLVSLSFQLSMWDQEMTLVLHHATVLGLDHDTHVANESSSLTYSPTALQILTDGPYSVTQSGSDPKS